MNILLLQTDIEWRQPDNNRRKAEEMILSAPPADLVVLPETFTTGFDTAPQECAEPADGITLAWMQTVAARKDAAVAGSIVVSDGGRYFNRLYFVKPDGTYAKYDKRHLFTPGGERERFSAGGARVIVEWMGCRILLQICYDLRFPVFARNRGDYDMILYVANWPVSRIEAWDVLVRARAIENQCYVVAVNRTGLDPFCEYNGHTVLVDYRGGDVAYVAESVEDAVLGVADMGALKEFRKKFPVQQDADGFELKL